MITKRKLKARILKSFPREKLKILLLFKKLELLIQRQVDDYESTFGFPPDPLLSTSIVHANIKMVIRQYRESALFRNLVKGSAELGPRALSGCNLYKVIRIVKIAIKNLKENISTEYLDSEEARELNYKLTKRKGMGFILRDFPGLEILDRFAEIQSKDCCYNLMRYGQPFG